MTCLRLSCYLAYVKRVLWYMQLCEYHKRRAIYAERNRHKEIPERYRTGEDTPTGFRLLIETLKLRGGF